MKIMEQARAPQRSDGGDVNGRGGARGMGHQGSAVIRIQPRPERNDYEARISYPGRHQGEIALNSGYWVDSDTDISP